MNFNIISEHFKEGSLDTKIQKHKIFSENQAKYVCKQLLSGIKYLNEHNLVHTDINPDIIYIKDIIKIDNEELYNVKILQFGSSSINIHKTNNSLNYMAPELINNKYHQTSDIWSIGIILYQMIFDDLPFKGYKEDEIINNIMKLKPDIINKDASPYVKNLLKKMLNKNPFKRITVNECLKHDWFSISSDKYKKINNNVSSNDNLKKFFLSHISGYSGEFVKGNKTEEDININLKKEGNKKTNKIEEKEKEKEKKINEKHFLENSQNSDSIEEESSSILSDETEENKEKEDSNSDSSFSYSSFSPARCKSNSICFRTKNIFSELGKKSKKNHKNKNIKKNENEISKNNRNDFTHKKNEKKLKEKKDEKIIDEKKNRKKVEKKKDENQKEKISNNKLNNLISNDDNNNIQEKNIEDLIKLKKKEIIKHISLTNKRLLFHDSNNSFLKRSFSLSILDDSSDKSNGQKLSPLLIDIMKYIKYNIQFTYYKIKEVEKIGKIFDKIINNKKKSNINNNKIKISYDDLFRGYLTYIGQKIFLLDSYSENKKIFIDLSKYINEDKKNGNIINTLYEKEDFIRILLIFKEKYLEYRFKNSYQKLKKSNVNEIFNLLNEIDQKIEFNYYKKYFNEIKNLIMKNRLKEIYLFYEFKNLIIISIKNIFNKELKEKKEKDKQKKEREKQNKTIKNYSFENPKNNGIKGIIRVVTKRDNSKSQNKVYHINFYDKKAKNLHPSFKDDSV